MTTFSLQWTYATLNYIRIYISYISLLNYSILVYFLSIETHASLKCKNLTCTESPKKYSSLINCEMHNKTGLCTTKDDFFKMKYAWTANELT